MNGLYAVGKRYSEFQTGLEGGQIGFDGSWTMVLNLPQMTKKEAESIRFGRAQISFVVVQDRLFFLVKFGDMPLADIPFEPALYKEPQDYGDVVEGEGISVLVLGVDSSNGELKVIRYMGLSTVQSNALHKACRELDRKNRPQSLVKYTRHLESIYKEYPRAEDLLRHVEPSNTMVFEGGK